MGKNINKIFILSLLVILVFSVFIVKTQAVSHTEDEEEDEDEDERGEELGTIALILLGFGGLYIVLRLVYRWSRSWSVEHDNLKNKTLSTYRRFRKPLLLIHNISTILAVGVGGIHGFLLLGNESSEVITGIIAWGLMVLISIFGLIIFYKFRPVWDKRDAKDFVRFIHRQWILSVSLVVVLLIHIS